MDRFRARSGILLALGVAALVAAGGRCGRGGGAGGGPCAVPPSLPVVYVDDADGDGSYDAFDVQAALDACAVLDGCVLEFLAETYDDLAINVSNGTPHNCYPTRPELSVCSSAAFSKGLVLRGQGPSTVLRSRLWQPGPEYTWPRPLLDIVKRPDLELQIHDLVLDGRKQEQLPPNPGVQDSVGWSHMGLHVWMEHGATEDRTRKGCIQNVEIRDFMTRGIHLERVDDWRIENVLVEDIGCWDALTPCPLVDVPDVCCGTAGYTASGSGLGLYQESTNVEVEDVTIRRSTKNGFIAKGTQLASGELLWVEDISVSDLLVEEAGSIAFNLAWVKRLDLDGARIRQTTATGLDPEYSNYYFTFGVYCTPLADDVTLRNAYVTDAAGMGVAWDCAGAGNALEHVFVTGSCREVGPGSCTSEGLCYDYPAFSVAGGVAVDLTGVEVHESACRVPFALNVNGGPVVADVEQSASLSDCQRADATRDGVVGVPDFQLVGTYLDTTCDPFDPDAPVTIAPGFEGELPTQLPACRRADGTRDGVVDQADVDLLLAAFGSTCEP